MTCPRRQCGYAGPRPFIRLAREPGYNQVWRCPVCRHIFSPAATEKEPLTVPVEWE